MTLDPARVLVDQTLVWGAEYARCVERNRNLIEAVTRATEVGP